MSDFLFTNNYKTVTVKVLTSLCPDLLPTTHRDMHTQKYAHNPHTPKSTPSTSRSNLAIYSFYDNTNQYVYHSV